MPVLKYSAKFDSVVPEQLGVGDSAIKDASSLLSNELKEAIDLAYDNIYKFHKAQFSEKLEVETTKGVLCWREKRPIESVGLYIPGGSAPLFSTVLMLGIPAMIAGCKEVVLCTPPAGKDGINPAILYAAQRCGIQKVYQAGGIQAVAAMTFGTQTIPQVNKLFGPGNQYVTAAKEMATRYGLAIDMPAGPSELLVLADDSADASFVAADLLSQAEHGPDSQVVLLSNSEDLLMNVQKELEAQLDRLPRKDIASKAIDNSRLIFMENKEDIANFINAYGPEHYILCVEDEAFYLDKLMNAGSVFIGNYTPESAGDYASGTNHTLPTMGYTKQYSGVNLDSYLKSITFQKISEEGIKNIGKTIEVMAEAEGLQAHKNAVSIRLKKLKEQK